MALPTILLAGAPKCATSSVYRWLVAQPGIVGAQRKEPFYLMDADHPLRHARSNYHRDGIDGYARLFPSETEARHRVDATTHYLYQETAARVAGQLSTAPKVVILLREPAMRAYSSFRFSQNSLAVLDPSLDFRRFVETVRRGEDALGRHCSAEGSRYVLARDLEYGHYVRYVDRWADAVDRDRLLILLTEDLRKNTAESLGRLGEFLQLDTETSDTLPTDNTTFNVRHRTLHALASRASEWLARHPNARQLVSQVYWSIQSRDPPDAMSDRDRIVLEALRREYAESNAALATRYDLDLAAWSRVGETEPC